MRLTWGPPGPSQAQLHLTWAAWAKSSLNALDLNALDLGAAWAKSSINALDFDLGAAWTKSSLNALDLEA